MDPRLENDTLWPLFHHKLVTCLYESLLPGLADRYRAQITKRGYTAGQANHQEEYIEIRERREGRLVTLIDVVSPANRTSEDGRRAYRETRRAGRNAGANLVEIDLVLQGKAMLDYGRAGLPDFDYAVTVKRSTQPDRYEVYTTTLQERLPRFRLPLAVDDRDTVLDLQSAFSRAFQWGGFGSQVDHHAEPPLGKGTKSAARPNEPLRHQPTNGKASSNGHSRGHDAALTYEAISAAAYAIWQREGCPVGRDKEHWERAIGQLQGQAH
jgi:hypothetical protein